MRVKRKLVEGELNLCISKHVQPAWVRLSDELNQPIQHLCTSCISRLLLSEIAIVVTRFIMLHGLVANFWKKRRTSLRPKKSVFSAFSRRI